MSACEQAPGMSMLDHGEKVHQNYALLIQELAAGSHACKELQRFYDHVKVSLPSVESLRPYHVYHDCGKHLVLHIDEHGKRHFPQHALASSHQYAALWPLDIQTIELIAHDMDFHTLRGEDIRRLWQNPIAPVLYLSAWAEINANADMFGGVSSESYKIKRSRLVQAVKLFFKFI